MTIKEALKPGQAEILDQMRVTYDPVIADEIEPAIDSLLECKIFDCHLPKEYCPHCDTRMCCAVYRLSQHD